MYGYVYKTTNLVNGKIYIGQHIHESWDDNYIGSGKILWQAINKYGIENFKCELIEEASSQKILDEREKFYIEMYNTQDRNVGYNIADGGRGGAHTAWNKDLTKDDPRVKQNWDARTKTMLERYGCAGTFGAQGIPHAKVLKSNKNIETILPEFEAYWRTHNIREVCKHFHIGKTGYNRCLEALGLNPDDEDRKATIKTNTSLKQSQSKLKDGAVKRIPIQCIETGVIYDSILSARKALGMSSSSPLYNAIYLGHKCRGYHWKQL